jgi:hypothetical protein
VTTAGQPFGKNVTASQNQKETQPHWYVERFPALLREVGVMETEAA